MTGYGRLKPWECWCLAFLALLGLWRLSHGSWFPGIQTLGLVVLYAFLLRRGRQDKASSATPKLFPD